MEVSRSKTVTPPRVIENDQAKILWDFQLQMDKLVMSNQLDIVVGTHRGRQP